MKMTSYVAYLMLLMLLFAVRSSVAQEDCALRKDVNGIKVYSCKSGDSEYNSVRAEFELKATLDQYIATVLDVERYEEWHFRSMNPRLLKKISDTEFIYYTQVSAPWPVSSRDVILKLTLRQNESTKALTVTLESMDGYLPAVNDMVRIPKSKSIMTLTPTNRYTLKVNFFIEADPGGQIPAWLVNTVTTQGPYETFTRLKERLEKN